MGAWEMIKDGIFWVIEWCYSWAGDWGLAIVIVTFLFRMLIFPISRKQFKSTYDMQKLQPKMQEIKEKYADDQQRQQEETAKLYQDAKFNPLMGCLPTLLQMPVFIALYQVLLELETRVGVGVHVSFFNIVPDLATNASTVFAEQGILGALPYIIMLVLFASSMLIPQLIQKTPQESQTRIMMIVMSGVMLFFGWNVPAGVLLYWDVSSYLGVAQQLVTRRMLERKDEQLEKENETIEPVKVDIDRAERKARPKKKNSK